MKVVSLLTSVLGVDEEKKYLEDKHRDLRGSKDLLELFGHLNFYWNYLSYHLLDKLLDELIEENQKFRTIKEDMKVYKEDIQKFRKSTTLALYCKAVPHSYCDPPPGFNEIVIKHQWPATVTLEDVEKFRERFMCTLNLKDCAAMVLHTIGTGSFKVTWFAVLRPSVLRENEGIRAVCIEFKVISVDIDGECIYQYQLPCHHQPTHLNLVGHYSVISDTESAADTTAVELKPSPQLSAVPGEALLRSALHALRQD